MAQNSNTCLDSVLKFETSALERIVREPESVLENEDLFWEEEPAQKYTTVWADNNGFTIDRNKWRKQLSGFAGMNEGERRDSPLMRTTDAILDGRESFLTAALPHVCSYLPEGTDTGVSVYFTAFIAPRAFVTGGIVINVDAPYWNGNAANILNTLAHEIWHVGYSHLRQNRTEAPLADEQLYGMLDQLQNEGTATWVGYQARSIFPAPDELDFRSLDSAGQVTTALEQVNQLFRKTGTLSEDRIRKLSWEIGVDGRAYYIAGAHMARIIDNISGRDALIRTIQEGPVSFVTAYNDVAPRDRRIEFPDQQTLAKRGESEGGRIPIIMIAIAVLGLAMLVLVMRRMMS
jgi:hypothetical protein